MRRKALPRARIEPRTMGDRLEQLGAEARERARIAGKVGIVLVRVAAIAAGLMLVVGFLVWIAPPPRSPYLEDLQRTQERLRMMQQMQIQTQRAIELHQQIELQEALRQIREQPRPSYPTPAPPPPAAATPATPPPSR